MKKVVVSCVAVLCGVAAAGIPQVSNIAVSQGSNRKVTVTYDLSGGTAAVFMDVLTNGVSIGRSYCLQANGDVNTYVPTGACRCIIWDPLVCWPEGAGYKGAISVRLTANAANEPPDYMTVDLTGESRGAVSLYASTDDLPEGVDSDIYRTSKLLMRRIRAAHCIWDMGADDEAIAPRHPVALQKDYWIGVFEVTQEQWFNVMGSYKGYFTASRGTRPVENVSYFEVRANDSSRNTHFLPGEPYEGSFMGALRNIAPLDFDLPTEAQWEFACRAGTTSRYYNGTDDIQPAAAIGYSGSGSSPAPETEPSAGGTRRVGSFDPNGFGLYDMYGNVSEWCVDCYNESNYGLAVLSGEAIDPCNWDNPMTDAEDAGKSGKHLRRGGGWRDLSKYGRSSTRFYWDVAVNSIGFRVMCHGPAATRD